MRPGNNTEDPIPPPPGSAPGLTPASRRSYTFFHRLAGLQIAHPWPFMLGAILLLGVSLALASNLVIRPGFEAMLPQSRPSVLELNRVKEHTKGISSVFVVLEGDDTAALRKAADAIVIEVAKIEHPWVGSVESGVHEAVAFVQPRAGLYPSLDELTKLHDDVTERWDYEVGKAADTLLDEDDDYQPPELDAEDIKRRFGLEERGTDRYPDGYYQSKDGKVVIVSIRSGVFGTNFDDGKEAIRRVREAVDQVNITSFHPSIHYGLCGDLVSASAEYRAINDDLTEVGLLGAVLIISVVFLYYLRMRTLIAMFLTISIGVSLTFGATYLLIGHLNMATGFLFTIVAGNGINTGIIYMARFLEARRNGEAAPAAIRLAHRDTWLPTLTAMMAASAAYASLMATEFRGFRDFGVIGGVGMILCWLCSVTFLPPILVITERVLPLDQAKSGLFGLLPKAAAGGTRFGMPFAALVARGPKAVLAAGLLLTTLASVATFMWVKNDPMEYNLLNLRTDLSARQEEQRLARLAEDITGSVGYDGMAILVDRPEQVPQLVDKLEARRDAAPDDAKPFLRVHTLQEFVPDKQAQKIPLLLEIKDRIVRSRKRGFIDDEQFADLEAFLPPDDLKPFTIDSLPNDLARAFTERDLRRGRIVYISPVSVELVNDARYLFRWADSYRHTELDDGSVVLGSGRAVIYADIWEAIIDDVPRAVGVSLALTLLMVAVAFRRGAASALIMGALLAGILWMTALLAVGGVRLNFLNFIALPITFGIGVDYAVNVMQRYRREGPGGAVKAVKETGGAVVLCSMTTTLGYLALVNSTNYAVRSLGVAAVLGEVACLLAAVIVLPAALVWRDEAKRKAADAKS